MKLPQSLRLDRCIPFATPPAARLLTGVGFAAALLTVLLGVTACGDRGAPADPYAVYRPALKADFQSEFDRLDQAPRYTLDVTLNTSMTVLTGSADILVTNYSPDAWRYLIFRLYPALSQYGGEMVIQGTAVNNRPASFTYLSENTAVQLNLTDPLPPGGRVSVQIGWRLTIPRWSDASSVYALFGSSQQMTSLPLFYPALAVYQSGPGLNAGTWWLDRGTARGDSAFNLTSLFVVTATLPSEQIPLTSGTLVASTATDDGFTRHVWVTGPVREFLIHMSPIFRSTELEAYGTRVISYWLPGQEAAGRVALDTAVASLRIYSDYYGPYPFREMQVAPAPLSYRGMEYPLVNLLGVELYTRFQNNMEILVAHEVAHQWWYQMVHNDPVNTPWLDEAPAEYSVKLYFEKLYGGAEASLLQAQRWQTPFDLLVAQDEDGLLNQPVDSFDNSSQYETLVYGKGALLYDRIHTVLGDRRFKRFLDDYLEAHRWGLVTTDDWRAAIAALQLPELDALFQDWVGETPRLPQPTAVPTPTAED